MNRLDYTMRRSEKHPRPAGGGSSGHSELCLVDPVDLLAAEDDEALSHIEQLEAAARLILQHGFSAEAFSTISTELRYVETSFRRHCTKQARHLLPLLLLHTEGFREADQWTWHDIWEKADELHQRVEDLEDGHIHATLVREMAEGCRQLAATIREQILRERQEILPIVKEVLTAKEYRQLQKKFTQQETP